MLVSERKSASPQHGHDHMMKVVDSFRSIVQVLRNSARDSEQKLGISGAQLYVLQQLNDASSLSINQLAERTYTHQSSVSMVVAKLIERRLVSRSSAKGDARVVAISLTPAGRALLRRSAGSGQARLVNALKGMPRADLRTLSANLETLTKLLREEEMEMTPLKRRPSIQS